MTNICALNRAGNNVFGKTVILVFLSIFSFSFLGFSQLEELEIDETQGSGIIHELTQQNDLGLIQLFVDDLDQSKSLIVQRELTKYSGEIVGLGISVLEDKVIISYRDPIYPNFLLAILDRVNINAHYQENGQEIHYVKDGNSSFIR